MSTRSACRGAPPWYLRTLDGALVTELAGACGLRTPAARALVAAGCRSAAEARAFLEPDFDAWARAPGFPSLDRGVLALRGRLDAGARVGVHGDYDTDGVLATLIMREGLRLLGQDPPCCIPTRAEGHGLGEAGLRRLAAAGATLVVTVDGGVSAVAEAELAARLGLELVVTDHHLPDAGLPAALAVVDPCLDGDADERNLCGAAVALKVVLGLLATYPAGRVPREALERFVRLGLVLAAVATVGDVVPLTGSNRTLVRHGLRLLPDLPHPGLRALLRLARLRPPCTAEDLAFQVVPRLNAAQRMGQGDLLWRLLDTADEQEAAEIASRLDELNQRRKREQAAATRDVLLGLERRLAGRELPPALVVRGAGWPEGLSGIIAGAVAERHGVPAAVVLEQDGQARGSCRAPEGFNVKEALAACDGLLERHGGHAQAGGFRADPAGLAAFEAAFTAACAGQLDRLRAEGRSFPPPLKICAELAWREVDRGLVEEVARLEPFGNGNDRPVFACKDLLVDGPPRYAGPDGATVMLRLARPGERSLAAVGFGMAEAFRELAGRTEIDAAFRLGTGLDGEVQLRLAAVRPRRRSA